jgi:putative transposase
MYYFKQNLKEKDLKDKEEILTPLFETAYKFYNELVYNAKNKEDSFTYALNDKTILNSIHAKKLGSFLIKTITYNFNINTSNYLKNQSKDASYSKPSYRNKDSEFFISFYGNNISVKNDCVLIKLNTKTISFKIPKNFLLKHKDIKQLRLHTSKYGYYLVYHYENAVNTSNTLKYKAGIDLGVDTLIACYSEDVAPLIISGKYIKFLNYKYSLKIENASNEDEVLKIKKERDIKIKSSITFAVKRLFDYLNYANVKEIYLGDFNGIKEKVVARNFYFIPHHFLRRKIKDYCQKFNIKFNLQEESYTSKTSFYDLEKPIKQEFSGERIERGLFRTKNGLLIHADINGAGQILCKKYNVLNRDNILLKPFYIDLVKEEVKAKSKIRDFFTKEFKRHSTIEEKFNKHKKDVLNFKFEKYVAYNAYQKAGSKLFYFYDKKDKKIKFSLTENENKIKDIFKNISC